MNNYGSILLIVVMGVLLLCYLYMIFERAFEFDRDGTLKVIVCFLVAATVLTLLLFAPEYLTNDRIQKNHIVKTQVEQVEQGDFLEDFVYELNISSNSIVISGFNEEKPSFFTQVYSNKRLNLPKTWNNLTIKMTESFYNHLEDSGVYVEFKN